jgi:hypothetical protein
MVEATVDELTTGTELDLDFAFHNTLYATHGLHPYAAKCPPPLAKWAIETYSRESEMVLDPMMGSGTTLVEARLRGRHSIGFDMDVMACFLARVKSTPVDKEVLGLAVDYVLEAAACHYQLWRKQVKSMFNGHHPSDIWDLPEFHNRNYWFSPEVSAALWCLKSAIAGAGIGARERAFLYLAFSSLILAKKSVANARDIVHSRHHYYQHPYTPDVLVMFQQRAKRMVKAMGDFSFQCQRLPVESHVFWGDARCLPLADSSVDLLVTSPPYCNALDYPRAHALGVGWLQDVLRIEASQYRSLGRHYIGSDRALKGNARDASAHLPPGILDMLGHIEQANSTSVAPNKSQAHYAAMVRRYFEDM